MKTSKKAAIGFIFITLLIDITGWGLVIPVFPTLIQQLTGSDISHAGRISGWLGLAYAAMQFICAPLIGNLSDQFGRRPVLLASLFGFGLDYLLLSFAPSLAWLFVGRIIAGFTGASITTATAYIADISTSANRAQNFGMIGAAFGLGFILGPVIGGLLGAFGPRVPFMAAASLCLLNALYGYFILPESLPKENRRKFEWKRANPFGSLMFLKKYPKIGELVISLMLIYIAAHSVQSTWSFFGIAQFGWDSKMIGISLGVVGLLVGAVQGGLIRVINPRLGNEKSIYLGLSLYAIGLMLFAFASSTWMIFVFLVPYCLGGIAGPALQSIIAGNVPSNEQGELQGALTSLMSITSMIGPPLMTGLFAWFTAASTPVHFPGAAFLAGSLLMIVSAILAYHALKTKKETIVTPTVMTDNVELGSL